MVQDFLKELHQIIDNDKFDIDKNFNLIKSSKEEKLFSTPFTLIDLEYDDTKRIVCVSFHYAKHKMVFPYA